MSKHELITHRDALSVYFNCYTESSNMIPSHWHQHLEVIYMLKGGMTITTNNDIFTLDQNDMFLVNSGEVHMTQVSRQSTIVLLQVPYAFLKTSIPEMETSQFLSYFSNETLGNIDSYKKIKQYLEDLNTIYDEKEKGYSFLFNEKLNKLIYELYINFSFTKPLSKIKSTEKTRDYLQTAIDYMLDHFKEHISLNDISKHLALNPEYFCRLFKKHIGFTFLEYLNQIRLSHIYNMLMTTDKSIMVIIEENGLSNYKVFNRLFKKTYGCTPSQARKQKNRSR